MKVGICLSSNGMVHADFAVSLVVLTMSAPGNIDCMLFPAESAYVAHNRQVAAKAAMANGCTHVLYLDSDMTFPAETIGRLLSHDKDIVACRYARRLPPYSTLGRMLPGQVGDLQEAIELPTGCMMIRTSVFEKLEAPYFRQPAFPQLDPAPPEMVGFDTTGYEAPGIMSEDYYFCQAARRAGFEVWADIPLSRHLTHIGMVHHKMKEE